jgi:hypothetical protein
MLINYNISDLSSQSILKWQTSLNIPASKMQSKIFSGLATLGSFLKKSGNQRDDNTDNNHRGYGKIDLQAGPVYDNITGQPAKGKFSEPWPEKP